MITGMIARISGPVITAKNMTGSKMYDVVSVGTSKLPGEIIRLEGNEAVIQVYEDTTGLTIHEPVENTGVPLSVELGPGLLASIYDGVQRPLPALFAKSGNYISRGIMVPGIDRDKRWTFTPVKKAGEQVGSGEVIGTVQEFHLVHYIMVPPGISGEIKSISAGDYMVTDPVCVLTDGTEIPMLQRWPVRKGRPFVKRLNPEVPLLTGQRVFDTMFPLVKGGTAMIPGGFGTGKTVSEQTLAKWADTQVVVYIGCGERGNEMTDVLTEFPELTDPRTGYPLIERTIMIANTSNMPVAAREASIYTGITMAEYYRDMGYDVTLLADSTSRWGEALREVSGRLEEMPGEEGYPAYLATRLAAFYERAGRVICTGPEKKTGSVTIIGAVSPPGGDFSEPITQNTLRIAGTFWALDANLAYRRHYPSVNWIRSYSLYLEDVQDWFSENVARDWYQFRGRAMYVLQKEVELQEIVQLVGPDALPDKEKVVLEIAKIIREDFLQQSAYSDFDSFCPLEKQFWMLKVVIWYYDAIRAALRRGVPVRQLLSIPARTEIARMKEQKDLDRIKALSDTVWEQTETLEVQTCSMAA